MIEYARHRAALGAKFHRTDWSSLQNLPAPPDASKRRMALLNRNRKFRKAIMRLCNILADRYTKYLEKYQNNFSDQAGEKVLVREHAAGEDNANEFDFEEQWDNFENDVVKIALNDVLLCKMTAKLDANKRSNSDGWENGSVSYICFVFGFYLTFSYIQVFLLSTLRLSRSLNLLLGILLVYEKFSSHESNYLSPISLF